MSIFFRLITTLVTTACLVSPAHAIPALFDFGLNVNGLSYCALGPCDNEAIDPATIPGLDSTGFDYGTGLGRLVLTLGSASSEAQNVSLFLDHEIDEPVNGFANEYGRVSGVANANQRFEIDEPGYVLGNLYDNFLANQFDNTNSVVEPSTNDVAMGLGWTYFLYPEQTRQLDLQARITFLISDALVPAGFHLQQIDPDSGQTLYFSSTFETLGAAATIPEPGALGLMGLAMLALLRRKYTV